VLPIIFGLSGETLANQEISLLNDNKIWGIILFSRNIKSKSQTINLTTEIKKQSKNPNIHILIDEEGGRITRLKEIYPLPLKAAAELGKELEKNHAEGKQEIIKTYTEIANRLKSLGINIACSPVADLTMPETHDIIGDRSFSKNIDTVIQATKIAADTLLNNNILPTIKHIPGHGRATMDSHLELPKITTEIDILENTDFRIFKNLNNYPLAMTAHIIYDALDPKTPITLSPHSISYIRNNIGYKGKIMTDDIGMKALQSYSLKEIISFALQAKCDYILHCNGDINEMTEIIDILGHNATN